LILETGTLTGQIALVIFSLDQNPMISYSYPRNRQSRHVLHPRSSDIFPNHIYSIGKNVLQHHDGCLKQSHIAFPN
jgi:hypothetical protein